MLEYKSKLRDNRPNLYRDLNEEGLPTAIRLNKLRKELDKLYLLDYTMLVRKSLNLSERFYSERSLKRENQRLGTGRLRLGASLLVGRVAPGEPF